MAIIDTEMIYPASHEDYVEMSEEVAEFGGEIADTDRIVGAAFRHVTEWHKREIDYVEPKFGRTTRFVRHASEAGFYLPPVYSVEFGAGDSDASAVEEYEGAML